MNDFEQKVLYKKKSKNIVIDKNKFIDDLHKQINISKNNKKKFMSSLMLIIILFILTINQNIILNNSNYYLFDDENYYGLDFYSLELDSIDISDEYLFDLSYFILEEGSNWEIIEFFNELNMEFEL